MSLPQDEPVVINSPARFHQKNNFTGLKWKRGASPTDVDGFIEFADKLFIFIESKYGDAPMLTGQRLALERVTDAVESTGRSSYCLVASHDTDPDEDIMLAQGIVTRIRHGGEWNPLEETKTVKEVMDELLAKHAPEYLDGFRDNKN